MGEIEWRITIPASLKLNVEKNNTCPYDLFTYQISVEKTSVGVELEKKQGAGGVGEPDRFRKSPNRILGANVTLGATTRPSRPREFRAKALCCG